MTNMIKKYIGPEVQVKFGVAEETSVDTQH